MQLPYQSHGKVAFFFFFSLTFMHVNEDVRVGW